MSRALRLLECAVELLPEEAARGRSLLFELGVALYYGGDGPRAEATLARAVAEAARGRQATLRRLLGWARSKSSRR